MSGHRLACGCRTIGDRLAPDVERRPQYDLSKNRMESHAIPPFWEAGRPDDMKTRSRARAAPTSSTIGRSRRDGLLRGASVSGNVLMAQAARLAVIQHIERRPADFASNPTNGSRCRHSSRRSSGSATSRMYRLLRRAVQA
jgi:hypothetical protein